MTVVSVIQLDKLSKTYHNNRTQVHAVNELSFTVEAGQIFGFLGPNGAGKTSTIRMLLRLMHPSSGTIRLFDTPLKDAQQHLRTRVGALVEETQLYPFMTGYDNLKTVALSAGITSRKRLDEVLDIVGMRAFAHRKAKTYSTGMKQRLGIALALLNDPDLLILDEPSNGLDPQGMQDVRSLLHHLAQNEGKTIFLSSHLLHEIEQTCDHVAIIRNGRLITQGQVSALLGQQTSIRMIVTPLVQAQQIVSEHFAVTIIDDALAIDASYDDIPEIIALLTRNDISIYEVIRQRKSLENLFLEVTHA